MTEIRIFDFIANLFGKSQTAEKPVSTEMQTAIDTWLDMYQHQESSANDSHSLDLPSAISSEFARLVMAESEFHVSSAFLDEQFQKFLKRFLIKADTAFALGSIVFKPYVSGKKILVDMIRADRYAPTAFDDSGQATAAVFMSRKVIGKFYYTRLETHTFYAENQTYVVENHAYCSFSEGSLGWPCDLNSVSGWEHLQEIQTIQNVERPLFSVYMNPSANTIDLDSPVGMSIYAHAADLIHEANQQWARIQWEFKGTELAVDASQDLFKRDQSGQRLEMPVGNKRLFRKFRISDDQKISDSIQTFSPAIRDESLFNGLNHILQRIEFNVGLAYGTLSNPTDIEKTAEEIRSSKQRSFTQVSKMQSALQEAFENLVYAMGVYASLYNLDNSTPELSCTWGDSVLEDTEKEFQRRLQLVMNGYLKPELFLMWYFGITKSKALEFMPEQSDDNGLFSGDSS